MKYGTLVWAALLVLGLSGCAPTTIQSDQPKNQDERLVVSAIAKIPDGVNNRSLDIIMQPYADDAYIGNFQKYLGVVAPGAPISCNKRELRATYAELFKNVNVKDLSMRLQDFRVVISGDRAVAEGETELSWKTEGSREDRREERILNDVLWRLQRTPAGWKIKEEIYQ